MVKKREKQILGGGENYKRHVWKHIRAGGGGIVCACGDADELRWWTLIIFLFSFFLPFDESGKHCEINFFFFFILEGGGGIIIQGKRGCVEVNRGGGGQNKRWDENLFPPSNFLFFFLFLFLIKKKKRKKEKKNIPACCQYPQNSFRIIFKNYIEEMITHTHTHTHTNLLFFFLSFLKSSEEEKKNTIGITRKSFSGDISLKMGGVAFKKNIHAKKQKKNKIEKRPTPYGKLSISTARLLLTQQRGEVGVEGGFMGESRQAPGIVGIFLPFCYMHFFFLFVYIIIVCIGGEVWVWETERKSLSFTFSMLFSESIFTLAGPAKETSCSNEKKKKIRKNKTNVFSSPRIHE